MRRILNHFRSLRSSGGFDPNSGQVIVLVALAAVGLIAIMGLAIDGGRLLFLRRDTQNAADAAAVAAARALCTARDPVPYALAAADANDFDNNRTTNWVDVYTPPIHAAITIPDACRGCYVEVNVKGEIPPSFISIVYGGDLGATGFAIGTCNPDLNNTGNQAPELRALWAMSELCSPVPVTVTGNNITISGGAHSNGEMKIMPSQGGGTVIGPTSAVVAHSADEIVQGQDKVTWSAGSSVGGGGGGSTPTGSCLASCFSGTSGGGGESIPPDGKPYLTSKKTSYPVDFKIEDFQLPDGKYAKPANDVGQYYEFPCSGKFWDWVEANHLSGGKLDDGIYYAACDMDISHSTGNITGSVTFVSTGGITVKGDGQQWQPYTANLLMFAGANDGCNGNGAVKFSGNNNSWKGIIFAPGGSIKMSAATNNSTAGCLVGLSVELSGSNNTVVCDNSASPSEPEPGIWLSE